ncbi:MAG: hypothetical protein ACYC10_14555 [Allorhizobium sp.]
MIASPRAIAVDAASGINPTLTPSKGLHFALSSVLAYRMAGNMIAEAPGTLSARRFIASQAFRAVPMRANGLEIS